MNIKEYRRKLRQAQQELKAFINANSEVLHRDYSREKVYGGLTEKEKDDKIELTTSNGIGVTKFSKLKLIVWADQANDLLVRKQLLM